MKIKQIKSQHRRDFTAESGVLIPEQRRQGGRTWWEFRRIER